MAFDGSGTFSRTNGTNSGSGTWAADRDAGTAILASRHDTHDQDIANALSNVICKDGQTTPTANIPFGGFKLTNVGVGTARTDGARVSQLQDGAASYAGTTAGAANAFTASLTPAITAYATGMRVTLVADRANTGASTLNLNAVGAIDIRKYNGTTALVANDILAGQTYDLEHNGTFWILLNPSLPNLYSANLQGLTASRPLDLDASKNLQTPTAATFKTTHSIAASGSNADITALTNCPSITDNAAMTIGSTNASTVDLQYNGAVLLRLAGSNFVGPTSAGGTNLGDATNYFNGLNIVRIRFLGTHGNSTKNPAADAVADWAEVIDPAGNTGYIPIYAA